MHFIVNVFIMCLSKERGAIDMVVRLNPVDFAKAMMKKEGTIDSHTNCSR